MEVIVMIVHNRPIEWYVDKLKNREYFSQGMYGDAEWLCIFHTHIGGVNAENTVYTQELCDALEKSISYKSDTFLFSVPAILGHPSVGMSDKIDKITQIEFVEKDMWDVESRLGGLVEFIKQLKTMRTCIISNKVLRELSFLDCHNFIEVSYPNCFDELESVMERVSLVGDDCVYLISAGLPAAIIAQQIHSKYTRIFALDLGSIWDAFVGIGSQRGWRGELYASKTKHREWKNLYREIWDGEP
jgi:hypothetical protein